MIFNSRWMATLVLALTVLPVLFQNCSNKNFTSTGSNTSSGSNPSVTSTGSPDNPPSNTPTGNGSSTPGQGPIIDVNLPICHPQTNCIITFTLRQVMPYDVTFTWFTPNVTGTPSGTNPLTGKAYPPYGIQGQPGNPNAQYVPVINETQTIPAGQTSVNYPIQDIDASSDLTGFSLEYSVTNIVYNNAQVADLCSVFPGLRCVP